MRASVKVTWVPRGSKRVAFVSGLVGIVFSLIFGVTFVALVLAIFVGKSLDWLRLIPITDLFLIVFISSFLLAGVAFALHGLNSPYRVYEYEKLVLEDETEIDLSSLPNWDLQNLVSVASSILSNRQYL